MDRPTPSRPPAPDLRIVATRVYRGPNVWSYGPAVHLVVELGSLEEHPTDMLPGFAEGLLAWLPGVGEHPCSRGRRGGFAERLREGTWVGHVAEHVALQLQAQAGHEVARGRTRSTGVPGQYNVVYGYLDASVALAAGQLAVRVINDLVAHDPGFEIGAELDVFLAEAARTGMDPSTRALVAAAATRAIPWLSIDGGVVQLGQGRHARLIRGSLGASAAVGAAVGADPALTGRVLASAGLPVAGDAGVANLAGRGDATPEPSGSLRGYRFLVVGDAVAAVAEPVRGADLTDRAHPDNLELAVDAARALGLVVAGVDIVAPDVARPVRGTGGGVRAIDPAPDLAVHMGAGRDVAGPVLATIIPPGAPSRIPVVAVTGSSGASAVAGTIARTLAATGRSVGLADVHGVTVARTPLDRRDASGPRGARLVLAHPRVEVAVLEVSRHGILHEGLGYDRNDVAVVLTVAVDQPATAGTSVEDLADVKSVVVEAVPPDGHAVLNADDPAVVPMARRCRGRVIWFSAREEGSPGRVIIDQHCASGGTAVVLDRGEGGDVITVRRGPLSLPLAGAPDASPAQADGSPVHAVPSAAACVALGVRLPDLADALAGAMVHR